jgi:hypothetical protein
MNKQTPPVTLTILSGEILQTNLLFSEKSVRKEPRKKTVSEKSSLQELAGT